MKKIILTPVLVLATVFLSMAQNVGIGTNTPAASAALEIKASNKGLLIPRTSTASRTGIASPAKGLMLYDTTTSSLWFHNGSAWVNLSASTGNSWKLTGNAGTNPVTDFIGTTDQQPLVFKVNNEKAGIIDYGAALANTAFGYHSLAANTGGVRNTAIGYHALSSNTSGYQNTAMGDSALYTNNAAGNTAVGSKALSANTTGGYNTATGVNVLKSNINGSYNTGSGLNALLSNIDGGNNTATGAAALEHNTGGINNSAHGMYALYSNTTGQQNTANGYAALYANDGGNYNSAHGTAALNSNIGSSYNTANGAYALYTNSSGVANTASGYNSLYNNTTGSTNTANGSYALLNNTEGNYNTATGSYALWKDSAGSANTANGYQALFSNYSGIENVAVGSYALYSNRVGWSNTAVGVRALEHNLHVFAIIYYEVGSHNTAFGYEALRMNYEGSDNVAIGYRALSNADYVVDYTVVGSQAGIFNADRYSHNPVNNTYVGAYADQTGPDYYANATAIGYNAIVDASNKVRIGDANVTVVESAAGSWTVSDGRFKNNITEDVKGLEFIKRLRPVSYNFDVNRFDEFLMQHFPDSIKAKRRLAVNTKRRLAVNTEITTKLSDIRQSGFVAQDVAEAARQSGYHFNGVHAPETPTDNWSLSYEKMVVPLVKALQEQQAIIEEQNKKINLRQQQMDALLKEMQLVKQKIK